LPVPAAWAARLGRLELISSEQATELMMTTGTILPYHVEHASPDKVVLIFDQVDTPDSTVLTDFSRATNVSHVVFQPVSSRQLRVIIRGKNMAPVSVGFKEAPKAQFSDGLGWANSRVIDPAADTMPAMPTDDGGMAPNDSAIVATPVATNAAAQPTKEVLPETSTPSPTVTSTTAAALLSASSPPGTQEREALPKNQDPAPPQPKQSVSPGASALQQPILQLAEPLPPKKPGDATRMVVPGLDKWMSGNALARGLEAALPWSLLAGVLSAFLGFVWLKWRGMQQQPRVLLDPLPLPEPSWPPVATIPPQDAHPSALYHQQPHEPLPMHTLHWQTVGARQDENLLDEETRWIRQARQKLQQRQAANTPPMPPMQPGPVAPSLAPPAAGAAMARSSGPVGGKGNDRPVGLGALKHAARQAPAVPSPVSPANTAPAGKAASPPIQQAAPRQAAARYAQANAPQPKTTTAQNLRVPRQPQALTQEEIRRSAMVKSRLENNPRLPNPTRESPLPGNPDVLNFLKSVADHMEKQGETQLAKTLQRNLPR
jgi:hypothetical protein